MLKSIKTHLHSGPRGGTPQVYHVTRDAQHGGESREPAESVRPPRVFVVHVLYGSPLH